MINPKNLIADFYMYQFLVTCESTYDTELELEIEYEALAFLDRMKEYLITILEYSIIREISHVWWETIDPNTMNPPSPQYMESVISEKIYYILTDLSPEWVDSLPNYPNDNEALEGCSRLKQYLYIKNRDDISAVDFITGFRKYFTKLSWVNKYGGEKWQKIIDVYLKLIDTNNQDLYDVGDHIFWLQHNTNSIFNKIPSWKENGGWDWINKFLDFRKECDIWDLLEYCGESKRSAQKKLKLMYNQTKEDRMKITNMTPEDITEPVLTIDVSKGNVYVPTIEDITGTVSESFNHLNTLPEQLKNVEEQLEPLKDFPKKLNSSRDQIFEYIKITNNSMGKLIESNTDNIIKDFTDRVNSLEEDFNSQVTEKFANIKEEMREFNMGMEQEVTMFKSRITTATEDTINSVNEYVDNRVKYLEDRTMSALDTVKDDINSMVDEKVNAILEKLEQRWYKSLWKWFKGFFTK